MTPRKRTTPEVEPATKPAAKAKPVPKARAKAAEPAVPAVVAVAAEAKPAKKEKAKAAPATPVPEPAVEAPQPAKSIRGKGKAKSVKPEAALAPETVTAVPLPATVTILPAEPIQLDRGASTILQAIREGRAVELIFKDADANPPRTFEPRQLIFDVFTAAWFIWGWDRRYNAERHHRVDALAEINLVEGYGRAAQGPFAEGTPANQIGGWRGGEAIPVKLVLQKQWVFAVRQAPAPFPDFVLEEGEDGKATVTFTATDLRAIARWCLQFGEGMQVLEPQRLVDRVKQVAQAWGAKIAPPPPAPKPAPAKAPEPPRSAPRPEPRQEQRPARVKEQEAAHAAKNPRVEIRFDRL